MNSELYLGLDVDKEWIVIAVAEWGRNAPVHDLGAISNDLHALEKLLARLRKRYGPEVMMRVCYEAGPCGFGIARRLGRLGVECAVVAPSLTPTRAGDRLKTDKRDARKLARLLRAGELSAIYIPEPTDEAVRDLCRARSDAVDDRCRSRHRLKAFLLRHGYRYQGRTAWSAAHERYLRELVLPHPAMKVILEEYLLSVQLASERIARTEAAMSDLLGKWRLEPAVRALMAMKGFQTVAAMIVVSELGALDRFTHPRQLMAYLGLVPSEKSSSDRRRQGSITKCGNAHARWLLVECAQHYAAPPKVSKELSRRQQNQSPQGALDQLESTEPVASALLPADGAPAPAQQSDRSSGARTVRLYLGITPHSGVLSRALPIRNQLVVRGEQLQPKEATAEITRASITNT